MHNIAKLLILYVLVVALTGCGKENGNTKVQQQNPVQKVVSDQVNGTKDTSETTSSQSDTKPKTKSASDVDIDLTAMNSDMVYATVYQMIMEPASYEGKTVRMRGNYQGNYYEPTKQWYHYCIIRDALACCAQGMEFVLQEENYPQNNAEITVRGTFEAYQDEGDPSMYCRLKDAVIEE